MQHYLTKRQKYNEELTDNTSSSEDNEEELQDSEEELEKLKIEKDTTHVSHAIQQQDIIAAFENSARIENLKYIQNTAFHYRIDRKIYKNKSNEKVIWFADHKVCYTLDILLQENSYVLNGFFYRHHKIKKFRQEVNHLIIMEGIDTDKTCMEPRNQQLHPQHIFRYEGRENEYVYRTGNQKGVSIIQMPEYKIVKQLIQSRYGPRKCEKHPSSDFAIAYKAVLKRYLWTCCKYCKCEKQNKLQHKAIQTIPGKADRLARDAISRQNKRKRECKLDDVKLLNEKDKKDKDILKEVLIILITKFLELDAAVQMGLKPNNLTLDKLDDVKKIYMNIIDNKRDFSNISITVNINNPSVHVDNITKQTLCSNAKQIRRGDPFETSISPEYLEALQEIKDKMYGGSQTRYTSDLTRIIAINLNRLCSHAKASQEDRRNKKGRKSMKKFDLADMTELKKRIVDRYIANGGRCEFSEMPICFAGLHGKPKLSIDRLDNDIGYDDKENIRIVAMFFQSELSRTMADGFVHYKWNREIFSKYGDLVYDNKLVYSFTHLDENKQESLKSGNMLQ